MVLFPRHPKNEEGATDLTAIVMAHMCGLAPAQPWAGKSEQRPEMDWLLVEKPGVFYSSDW